MKYFSDLPMVFGTETEFGFSFGRVLNETKAKHFSAILSERIFYLIIKRVAEKTGAFVRKPWHHWERPNLNHLEILTVQKLAEAAISGQNDNYLPKRLFKLASQNVVSINDIYIGEIGIFLPNGSRLYVDGFHLEYSISECRDPYEVVCQEKAMEKILAETILEIQEICGWEIFLFKNNTDYKGNSYACHSNYLLRSEFFNRLYEENIWSNAWLSFIATSIIYLGSGKVGYEKKSEPCSYQISQRADHIFRKFSANTMHERPMINLRSESLADSDKWGRFHVILDDSNMSEWPIYLKVGTKALVLNMLQHQYFSESGWCGDLHNRSYSYDSLSLDDPVEAMKFISRDLTCQKPIPGSCFGYSALEIQKKWLDLAEDFYFNGLHGYKASWIFDVIEKWGEVLEWIQNKDPILDSILDWRIKKCIIELRVEKRLQKGQSTSEENKQSIDLQYHAIGNNGFYNKLAEVKRFAKNSDIEKARFNASEKTRAWFRSQFIKRFPQYLIDASWELLIFNLKVGDFETRVRLDPDPILSTQFEVGQVFEEMESYEEFCRRFLDLYLSQKNSF